MEELIFKGMISGRRNSRCKGPRGSNDQGRFQNSKKTIMAEASQTQDSQGTGKKAMEQTTHNQIQLQKVQAHVKKYTVIHKHGIFKTIISGIFGWSWSIFSEGVR